MNLKDILKQFEETPSAFKNSPNTSPEPFGSIFEMWFNWTEMFDERVKKLLVPGANWVCTDTRVGLALYTLDGQVVALSSQDARKSEEYIAFVSKETALLMRAFLISTQELELPIADADAPIQSGWWRGEK